MKTMIIWFCLLISCSAFSQKKYEWAIAPNGKDTIAYKLQGKPAVVTNDSAFVALFFQEAVKSETSSQVISQLLSCVNAKGEIFDRKKWFQIVHYITQQQ